MRKVEQLLSITQATARQRKHEQPKGEKGSHAPKLAQSPPKKNCPVPTGVSHAQCVSQLFSSF